jgi:hypothetical protein
MFYSQWDVYGELCAFLYLVYDNAIELHRLGAKGTKNICKENSGLALFYW